MELGRETGGGGGGAKSRQGVIYERRIKISCCYKKSFMFQSFVAIVSFLSVYLLLLIIGSQSHIAEMTECAFLLMMIFCSELNN